MMKLTTSNKILREILRQEKCANNITEHLDYNINNEIFKQFSDCSPEKKIFSGIGEINPTETVAKVNKALLRENTVEAVKKIVFQRNQPYIHLAYYPKGYRNICTFRVDCDKSEQHTFNNVVAHATKHDFPMTWFIEVAAQENFLKDVAAIQKQGHDVQLHCYQHLTYNTYAENERNIRKGRELMEASGIPVRGFASPFGKWNPALNRVLEEMKFTYSSEFAMGYDDLPFFPMFKDHIYSVLQIPVHPICIGSLRDIHYTENEMIAYFDKIIKLKYQRNSPIMLYGHPRNEIDQFPEVTDFILSSLKKLPGVWLTTYTEYADWWLKRLKTRYTVEFDNEGISVVTDNPDASLQLHIVRPDSTEAYLPLITGRTSLSGMDWMKIEPENSPPTIEIESIPSSESTGFVKRIWSRFRNK